MSSSVTLPLPLLLLVLASCSSGTSTTTASTTGDGGLGSAPSVPSSCAVQPDNITQQHCASAESETLVTCEGNGQRPEGCRLSPQANSYCCPRQVKPITSYKLTHTCSGESTDWTAADSRAGTCSVKTQGAGFAVTSTIEVKEADFAFYWESTAWPAQGASITVPGGLEMNLSGSRFDASECVVSADETLMGAAPGRAWANVACKDAAGCTMRGFIKLQNCAQ